MALITLRVLDGADRGRIYDDVPTPVTIGREEGNTIQLNDERVSRFHLKIQEDRDKVVLTDLESTNGTKVNGEDIQLRILRFGDMISVGRSVLLFGKREQIAERLAAIRRDADGSGSCGASPRIVAGWRGPGRHWRGVWRGEVEVHAGGGDAFLLAGQQGQRAGIGLGRAGQVQGARPQLGVADGGDLGRVHQRAAD